MSLKSNNKLNIYSFDKKQKQIFLYSIMNTLLKYTSIRLQSIQCQHTVILFILQHKKYKPKFRKELLMGTLGYCMCDTIL